MRRTLQRAASLRPASSQSTFRPGTAFVCYHCREQSLQSSSRTHAPQTYRRNSSSFTDTVRKGLHGKDQVAGQKDPYSQEERAKVIEEQERTGQEPEKVWVDPEQNYEPAKTWDWLERIGGPHGWWEEAWDQENQFKGFMPQEKIAEVAIEGAIRRSMVEVLTLRESNRPMTDAVLANEFTTFDYSQAELSVRDGNPTVTFEHEGLREELLESIPSEQESEVPIVGSEDAPAASSDENVAQQASPEEPSWYGISLGGAEQLPFKFALLKRVMQLTGARIPDPAIHSLKTAGDVVKQLLVKPKPKALVEVLMANEELMALPNVEIFESRYSPIDKQKEVGRWKVIEKELRERGLPITGRG